MENAIELPEQPHTFLQMKIPSFEQALKRHGMRGHIVAVVANNYDLLYLQTYNKEEQFFLVLFAVSKAAIVWKTPVLKQVSPNHKYYQKVSDHQFIILRPTKGKIDLVLPLQQKKTSCPFKYASYQLRNSLVYYFQKTKLICVAEVIGFQTIKFTYLPLQNQEIGQPAIVVTEDKLDLQLIQLDDFSRIGSQSFNFHLYRMVELDWRNEQWNKKKISLASCLDEKKIAKLTLTPNRDTIKWKVLLPVSPTELLIKTARHCYSPQFSNSLLVIFSNGYDRMTVRKLNLKLNNIKYPLPLDPLMKVQFKSIEAYLIVQMRFICNKEKNYLFVNQKKQIQFTHRSQSKIFQTIGSNLTLEVISHQEKSEEICITDWVLTRKNAYLHVLLFLNQDFDDDLLQDCIYSLEGEEE